MDIMQNNLEAAVSAARSACTVRRPSAATVRGLCRESTPDSVRRRAFFDYHPGAHHVSRYAVDSWLDELSETYERSDSVQYEMAL